VYYLLVSSANGGYIANAAMLNIANTFLSNVATANVAGTTRVGIGPGQNVSNIDFGNIALPALSGDYNRNGTVDQSDFVIWRKTLGNVVARYSGADGDGDGVVDQDDFEIWLAHVGETLAAPGAGSLAESITVAAPSNESTSVEISPRSLLRMNQTPVPREATGDEQTASQRNNYLPDLVPASSPFAHGRPAVRGLLGAELAPAASRHDEALMAWLASQSATKPQSDALDVDEKWNAEDANDSDDIHIDSVDQIFLLLADSNVQ
jgi:hypothetical protein